MEPEKLLALPPGKGLADMLLRDEMGKLWALLEFGWAQGPRGGRVVCVTAPAPGDGCTTVAVALARFLAFTLGRDTCLVEADFRRPTLGRTTAGQGPGLFELLAGKCSVDDSVRLLDGRGLALLPAGKGGSGAFFPPEEALAAVLERLRDRHDAVVLDCPALGLGAESLRYIEKADAAVLVARAGRTRLESLQRCVNRIRESGTPLGGVVLNRVVTALPGFLRALS